MDSGKKLNDNNKNLINALYIIESLLFLSLCCVFTPRVDDIIFRFNEFFQFTDFKGYLHSVIYYGNGRILGNALCIAFSKIPKVFYFVEFFLVQIFCFSAERLVEIKNSKIYFLTIFLLQPILLVKQLEAWMCAFINYFIPILLLVFILNIMKKCSTEMQSLKRFMCYISIFLLGIAEQLFIEHNSVMNLIIAISILIVCIHKHKKTVSSIILITANIIGAAIIFCYRLYIDYNETWVYNNWQGFGRTLFSMSDISQLIKTVAASAGTPIYFYFACVVFYMLLLSVILTVDKKDKSIKHKKLNVALMLLYFPCAFMIFMIYVTDRIEDIRFGFVALFFFVFNIIGLGYSFIKAVFLKLPSKIKIIFAVCFAFGVISYAPFLINGSFAVFRGCYFAYVLMGIALLYIADFAKKEYGFKFEKQLLIFAVCACIVCVGYFPAFYESRSAYNYKAENYKTEYYLPRGYSVFGDSDAFWEFAEDNIEHKFIPYKEFKEMQNNH